MFSFFEKRCETRRISDDLHETMENAYDAMRIAVAIQDSGQKHHEMFSRLTSLSLALTDV